MNSATNAYQKASSARRKEQLILDHIGYVRKILSTVTVGLPEHYDKENLEQAGLVGLVEMAEAFDPSRGVSFTTFCYPRVLGAIVDEMRKNSPVPQQMLGYIKQVKKAYNRLESPVTPEDLALETGLTVEKIAQVLEAMRFTKPQSWNDLYCNVHSGWRHDEHTPERDMERAEMKKVMADCIQKLPDRERLVLTLYYTEDLNLAEIGKVIDVSESRTSRILASAKFRLKEFIAAYM